MSEQTIEKLKKMKLSKFAEAYQDQKGNPEYQKMSFDDRLTLLVDLEYDSRVNHTIERNIRNANFYDSTACLERINYKPERKIDKALIEELSTNQYIEEGLNVVIAGASGCGKTWISNALGVHACRSRKRVKYIRLPELLMDLETARIQGTYRKMMKQLGKLDLLIIDEFLLSSVNETEVNSILEIMELRCNKKSTILCSQWTPEGWYQKLGGGPIADAILDRIINSSYKILLEGTSMREEYSKLK